MNRRKTMPGSGREGWHVSLGRQEYQFWYHKYQFWGRIRVYLSSTLPSSVKTVASCGYDSPLPPRAPGGPGRGGPARGGAW